MKWGNEDNLIVLKAGEQENLNISFRECPKIYNILSVAY